MYCIKQSVAMLCGNVHDEGENRYV